MEYLQCWYSWCHMKLLPSQCTPYNHAPSNTSWMQSHTVTCHLQSGQNDWSLVYTTAVTHGWNRYPNKSQHRNLTLEKKKNHQSCRELNLWPFDHKPSALNTELSPLPQSYPLSHWAIPSRCLEYLPSSWMRTPGTIINSTTLTDGAVLSLTLLTAWPN